MIDNDDYLLGLAATANKAYAEAQVCFKSGVEHAMRAGRALIKAKAKLGHGAWYPWLANNFDGSERTAQLYMRLVRYSSLLDDETRNDVADLSLREAAEMVATPRRIVVSMVEETVPTLTLPPPPNPV